MAALDKEELKKSVRRYIADNFLQGEDVGNVTDDVRLVSDGILDSLASLKLVSYLEETFNVTIEAREVDVDHLDSLDSIANLIIAKRAQAEGAS